MRGVLRLICLSAFYVLPNSFLVAFLHNFTRSFLLVNFCAPRTCGARTKGSIKPHYTGGPIHDALRMLYAILYSALFYNSSYSMPYALLVHSFLSSTVFHHQSNTS